MMSKEKPMLFACTDLNSQIEFMEWMSKSTIATPVKFAILESLKELRAIKLKNNTNAKSE